MFFLLRDDPVGPSVKSAIQELAFFSETRIYGNWLDIKEGTNLDLVGMRSRLYTSNELVEHCKPTEVLNCDQVVGSDLFNYFTTQNIP